MNDDIRLPFRLGEGWDTHVLVEGRPLMLGGVHVPHDKGLLGHSDADALLHAITDALLGGAGLGDIGRHFPDTDAQFKGADSVVLLVEAAARVRAAALVLLELERQQQRQRLLLVFFFFAFSSCSRRAIAPC